MLRKLVLSLSFISLMVSAPLQALEYKVAAIVNGKAITNLQVSERVDIILDSTGLKNTAKNRREVTKETVDILINETLQEQEAKDKGISLKQTEIDAAIIDLEQKNGMKPGSFKQFIESRGLSYQAALDQIKAGLLWKKTVTKFLRPDISVSDKEIEKRQDKLAKVKVQKLYSISEIILPLDVENPNTSKLVANKIADEAREKNNFAELAKKHSAGRTGKKGGYVGLIPADKVVEPLASMIKSTPEGQVSEPKLVENAMYVIIKVNQIREVGPPKDEKSIEDMLIVEELEKDSKKYIKKLRQKAYIEKKYNSIDELV